MKKNFCLLWGLLLSVSALSQAVDGGEERAGEFERVAIQEERAREAVRFADAEAACYSRFAVTDCLLRERAQRRVILDRLRRRELALKQTERQRDAARQMERIQQKSAPSPASP